MLVLFIIIAVIVLIVCLPHCFETYTNMKYVEHLEERERVLGLVKR